MHCFAKGHAALQSIALQIITDILTTHPSLLAPTIAQADPDQSSATATTSEPSALLKPVLKAFAKSLKSADPDVQATGANALSRLMLSQLVTDSDLLKQLVIAFFDPETSGNASLRQTLSYFLPVYCHSRAANAERMATVVTGVVSRLTTLREAYMDDEDVEEGEMVTLATIGGLLVDWTDPRKIIGYEESSGRVTTMRQDDRATVANNMTHFILADQILEKLVTSQTSSEQHLHRMTTLPVQH